MTEDEWLSATDPGVMLMFLGGKTSDRKLRLCAVGCCRRIWPLLDKTGQRAIEIYEQHADGLATAVDLERAGLSSLSPRKIHRVFGGQVDVRKEAIHAVPRLLLSQRLHNVDLLRTVAVAAAREDEFVAQACCHRDIFGNLFRHIALNPSWLTANVRALGQAIYDERQLPSGLFDNHRLAILADALEDAGCDNADILDHCRKPGDHVRGCWVVDLVLGKT